MKKSIKILSLALVLVMALSVMVLPTSAAEPTATAEVAYSYQGKTASGYDYYKFSVYLDTSLSLNAYQLNVTWDNAVWQLLNPSTKADSKLFNKSVIDTADTENIMYKACDAYQLYGMEGTGDGAWVSDACVEGYGYMPGDQANPTFAKISDTNMGAELKAAGYTGFYSAWAGDFTDHFLCISGGTVNQANSPTSGKVMVLSWYMRLKDNVAPGQYEVGFNAQQAYQLTAQYCWHDALTTKECSDQLGDIPAGNIAYNNAVVTVGAAGPALTYAGRQVKMTVKDGVVVSGTEQLRVVSTISAEDWNNYFANTTNAEATTDKILDVGFVAFKGKLADFDVDTAKAAAQDPKNAAAGYSVAATTYIQNDVAKTGTYRFGARVEYQSGDVFDTTYMAFVHYKDASGIDKYAFYDTSDIGCLEFKTNYTTITDAYIGHVSGK